MKTMKITALIGVLSLAFMAFTFIDQSEDWEIPAKYQKMTNPTDPGDEEGLDIGKDLYMKHCKSCHGKEGYGDGPKAAEVEGDLGDFSTEEFHAQKDGVIFYKSYIGRKDMPNFEKKIPDEEEMWFIINFMKTLAE
jgi:mono/diheme cytochrome c family protein